VDTVPGIIEVKEDNKNIYGRGTCDNKQSIAASIILLEQLSDINVLFTVGEEVDFCGAIRAQKSELLAGASLVVVQEPTNFEIVTGQRGLIIFKIITRGVKQHSSLDNPQNAITLLSEIIVDLDLKKLTGFNAGIVSGGMADNIVADEASMTGSFRPDNKKEFRSVMGYLKKLNFANVQVEILKASEPYESESKYPRNIAKHFSEMDFFPNAIQFGAGKIELAHTDNEYIDKKDLNELVKKLKKIILQK
jgi:acetylornithine deacetylase/succinyl-diaminopimelate desuccinylase-like protein